MSSPTPAPHVARGTKREQVPWLFRPHCWRRPREFPWQGPLPSSRVLPRVHPATCLAVSILGACFSLSGDPSYMSISFREVLRLSGWKALNLSSQSTTAVESTIRGLSTLLPGIPQLPCPLSRLFVGAATMWTLVLTQFLFPFCLQ